MCIFFKTMQNVYMMIVERNGQDRMGQCRNTICDAAPKQLPDKHTNGSSDDDARHDGDVGTNRDKHRVFELRTPYWRRLERGSSELQRKWSAMFAGCIHGGFSTLWDTKHVLPSDFDGNARLVDNRSSKAMECLTTSTFLCILLRFALDARRIEQAIATLLTKSHMFGAHHHLFDSCESSYESSKKMLYTWFMHVIEYLETIHTRVNIEVHDSCIFITDCLKVPIVSKEDIEAFATIRKQWRLCFEHEDARTQSLTRFKAHEESIRVIRRIPFVKGFFSLMQTYAIPPKCDPKMFRIHMQSQLFFMAQRCKSLTLLFLTERTMYSHIEDPYPCATPEDERLERAHFANEWLVCREKVQELYAIHAFGLACIRLAKRIASGKIHIPLSNRTIHSSVEAMVQKATSATQKTNNPMHAAILILGDAHVRVFTSDVMFSILTVIHDAHQIMQTETNVSKRWSNACVPHVMLCAAMTLLLGSSECERSADIWNAMTDICTLNGADKEDSMATIPFLSPFDLPDTVHCPDECIVSKMTHILSVVATLQHYPHALEISLATWVFVSMCTVLGVGLEPLFMQSGFLANVVNAFLFFEQNKQLEPLAHRVAHRIGPIDCEPGECSVPIDDVFYDSMTILQKAIHHGELAHAALLYEFFKTERHTCVTLVFSPLNVSAMDLLVSMRNVNCVVFETEMAVYATMSTTSLESYCARTGVPCNAQTLKVRRWKTNGLLETARHAVFALDIFDKMLHIVQTR